MIEIIHTPHGQEHPYEQLPEERFPRRPLAGEPFTVGIVTRPPHAVKQVVVRASIDSAEGEGIPAERLPSWQPELEEGVGAEYLERVVQIKQDVWQAHLTAPDAGHTLTYRIEADGQPSDEYTLVGAAWQAGGGVTVNRLSDNRFEMRLEAQASGAAGVSGLPEIVGLEWLSSESCDGSRVQRVRVSFACSKNDAFFGLGERFNALNQRGNVMDVRVYEQYKSQGERTYMPIPFPLSSAGYGVYAQSSRWMQFDLASTVPDRPRIGRSACG
jgi:hypothetical protein